MVSGPYVLKGQSKAETGKSAEGGKMVGGED